MNTLLTALGGLITARRLDEKWLLAPSRRAGNQWLTTLARSGIPSVNVRVKTVRSMALDLSAPLIAERGLARLSGSSGPVLVAGLWEELRQSDQGYLFSLKPSRDLSDALWATVQDMRLAGISEDDLAPERFESPVKAQELRALLKAYQERLKDSGHVDQADMLRTATERLVRNPNTLGESVLVIIPDDLRLAALERALFDALPDDRRISLPVDRSNGEPPESARSSMRAAFSLWSGSDAESSPTGPNGKLDIFRAAGKVNEVREVLRRCLDRGYRLDEVEILYTDSASYAPLIYETVQARWGESTSFESLPVTFAEGVPIRYTRPGRALAAWCAWIDDDFMQTRLVRMIQDGLLDRPKDAEDYSFSELSGALRSVRIGMGRDRYLRLIDQEIAACQRKVEEQERDEDGEEKGSAARYRRKMQALSILRDTAEDLLGLSPITNPSPREALQCVLAFVQRQARCAGERDTYARQRLVEEIEDLLECPFLDDGAVGLDIQEWIRDLPGRLNVGGSSPRSGCIHVDRLLSGGHSGRAHTFVVGLEEGLFPGGARQDPIALDSERRVLSDELVTSDRRVAEKTERLSLLVCRLRGTLSLSYSSHDLTDDRETFPSTALLSGYRTVFGKPQGALEEFLQDVGAPASFAPSSPLRCMSADDWLLWRTCSGEGVCDTDLAMQAHFPHLLSGRHALESRACEEFTEFDGHVPEIEDKYDPCSADGPVVSASRLQAAGECAFRYFLRYVLKIEPPDELEIDRERWLGPLEMGSLLHEVFRRFMYELTDEGLRPEEVRDSGRIRQVLEEETQRYRRDYPVPSEQVFQRQRRELLLAAGIFLRDEERHCRAHTPYCFEASIGMTPEADGSPADTPDPVTIALPSGHSLRVRGRVDRTDRIGDAESLAFAVCDYKTGSTYSYSRTEPFQAGRHLQPVLYIEMMRRRLREMFGEGVSVDHFEYFFPGHKAEGERYRTLVDKIGDGLKIIELLCETIRRGAFVPTRDTASDCTFCDYLAVCGDLKAMEEGVRAKLAAEGNDDLEPVRELRCHDKK